MRIAALGLALILSGTAVAAEPVEVRYDVYWGGFRAAEARLVRDGREAGLMVRATGLLDSLSAFALDAEAQHERFRSHSRSKKTESLLAVDFHGRPQVLVDEIRRADPDDKPEPRPEVPEAMRANTMDPLTALVTASERVLSGQPGERFTLAIFDGRNRYDALISIVGPGSADISGRRVMGTRATIQFKPLAGFRKKSLELWDGATFTLLLDPRTRLPARIVSDSFTIATVISALPLAQRTGG